MAEKDKRPSAVYVSWATLKNALDQLAETLPGQIDRSVFPGLAWAIQNQLLTGMKFLGLIDERGKPTAALAALTDDSESARKDRLRGILKERYANVFALDLTKDSPLQVRTALATYGVSGDTLDRAMRFLIGAAEYCGIPLSPLLSTKKSNGPAIRKKRIPRPKTIPTGEAERGVSGGTSKTVQLRSGGSLTVSASLDLFALNPDDRKFIFGLIDELEKYERDSAKTESPDVGASGETTTKGYT